MTELHPARFSKEIRDLLIDILRPLAEITDGFHIHDPFAGSGERLEEIAAAVPCTWSGTEIEAEFIVNAGVSVGDATDPGTYPTFPYTIVTSPVYPNGMADSWAAADGSKRNTYRHRLAHMTGRDRELHRNNMGRYGYRGTGPKSTKRAEYWRVAREAVAHWSTADAVIVNVSDFIYTKRGVEHVEPVVADWAGLLRSAGWTNQMHIPVGTRRNGHGANRDQRVDHETIIVATRKAHS